METKYTAYGPNGERIIGTLEEVRGCALASSFMFRDGLFWPDYEGETEMHWDSQMSVMRDGQRVFLDQNGKEWLESQVTFMPVEPELPQATERYIAAACRKFHGDTDVAIDLDAATVDSDTIGGAWVSARIFVADDELEPLPGPSYGVFQNEIDWRPDGPTWSGWTLDARFTCDGDSDGKQARAAAHAHARDLRATYPAALVAVRNLSAANWAPRTPRLPD